MYKNMAHQYPSLISHGREASERGFTLVETFVAVSVLMLALVGPLSLAQQSLSSATTSGDQITAFYLAQDAMEFIRNARDSNLAAGEDWLNGFSTCLNSSCAIDTTLGNPIETATSNCGGATCILMYNQATDQYGHQSGGGWSPSLFTREISIDTVDDNEILVTVRVTWDANGYDGEFEAKQSMFNLGGA